MQNQTRDIRFATLSAKQFEAGIDVSEDEIKTYYQANQIRFENKEQVKVDYIRLTVADIAKDIQISDEDITSYYQDNITSFTQAEQRRVSHILIEFTEGDSNSEATAKIQAETILTRIVQGEDFATLAKELSNDTFSGENGGDLDFIETGVMEPSFDDAAFALATVGDITKLVKTSFGYHVIKLTELKPQVIQSLADVKVELQAKVSNEKAQDKFLCTSSRNGTCKF